MKCAYNKRSGILFCAIVTLFMSVVQIQAGISVKVFSRDEALNESNMSKPRIYIKNTGDVALSGVKLYYYFSTESSKIPVLEKYYIPGFTVTLSTVSAGNYKLEYTLTSTLNAGAIVPGTDGCAVGLHYNNWSFWDKTNDCSNNLSATFTENQSINVIYSGNKIYGDGLCDGTTPTPETPEIDIKLNSFALYSTEKTSIKQECVFSGGGAVGSNVLVEISENALVHGNVVSGGNAILWHNVTINGDIILGGTLTQSGMGNSFNNLEENASVTTLTLPDYPVVTNTNHKNYAQNTVDTLEPGIYGHLKLLQDATLKLQPGNYTFKDIYVENGAKIVFMIKNYQEQIDISSSGEFAIQDRAELQFESLSYAPSVRIYSRDQNDLRIGVDAKTAGIITAPFATVNIYTGAQCDGAVYAKIINVEPGAIINSEMVTDDDDYDNDGVPTLLEIVNCVRVTNPKNGNDYEPQAIPDKLVIDNTQKVIITYDLNRFYNAYSPEAKLIMICPPGALQDPTKPPVIQLSAVKPAGLPAFTGYVPVGMYFQIKCNQINDGKQIYVGIPMPGNSTTGNYDMAMHVPGENSWTTFQYPYTFLSGLSDEDRNLLMDSTEVIAMVPYSNSVTDNVGTLVATWKVTGTAVAYFDDGTVFSSKTGSEIEVTMTLTDVSGLDPANPGKIIIDYTDLANPLTDILPVELDFSISGNVITCVGAINATSNGIRLNSVIVKTRLASGTEVTVLSKSPALEADQSESFYIHASCKLSDIDKDKNFSIYKVATMAFESAQLAGDGLITKEGSDFKYDYFLKDHLGSTRMVLNQDGAIQQALMYQPYGTVSNVDEMGATATDPLREKFTTKEFDEEGDANGAPGIQVYYFGRRYYDSDLGTWFSTDRAKQLWNVYKYHDNPLRFVDPNGDTFLSLLKPLFPTLSLITAIASNVNAMKNQQGFGRMLAAGVSDALVIFANDIVGPGLSGVNMVGSTFANWGSNKWSQQMRAIWDNEVATFRNIGASENFGDFGSNFSQSGYNDYLSGLNGLQFMVKDNAEYHGLMSDERKYTGVVWSWPGEKGGAFTTGHHIVLQDYYREAPDHGGWNETKTEFEVSKGAIIRHELTHVGQSGKYGIGGMITLYTYGVNKEDYKNDAYYSNAFWLYGNSTWLNWMEWEAQKAMLEWEDK